MAHEVLEVCEKCGQPKRIRIKMTENLFTPDQKSVMKEVTTLCGCEIEQRKQESEANARRKEIDRIRKLQSLSLIDSRLMDATFESFDRTANPDLFRKIEKYVEGFDEMETEGQGLMFTGPVGSGKSYAAAVIANELIRRDVSVIMTSFIKLIKKMGGFEDEQEDYVSRLNSARLLIIDDLGAERSTDYALEKVYDVIDSRYRSKKPLILTTNIDLKDMMDEPDIRYGRIYDRIFEMCYPITVNTVSWRKSSAERNFNRMREFMEG